MVSTGPDSWNYQHDSDYIDVWRKDGRLWIEVGTKAISEEPAHGISLGADETASLMRFLNGKRADA